MSVRLILSQRKKLDQTNRTYGIKCERQRSKNFQAQPVYWFPFRNTEIICHITSYYRFTLHCKITWWLTWGSEHQQQSRAESDFLYKVSPQIKPSCWGRGERCTSPALLIPKFSSTKEQQQKINQPPPQAPQKNPKNETPKNPQTKQKNLKQQKNSPKPKDKSQKEKMKCTQAQPWELGSSGCSSVRMEGWDGEDIGGIGNTSPWKRLKETYEC